jgi:two-component system invasion response regulator UvrY
MYRILLADDHTIVRAGVKAIIMENLTATTIDEAANEDEVVRSIKSSFYDLLILDINMPDTDFINLVQWLRIASPETNIIVLSMYAEELYAERCLQLGAKGYLNKAASNEEIAAAIKKVLVGKIYVNEKLVNSFAATKTETQKQNPFADLSSRELEIALLINRGHSLPEISTSLNIQYSTVNTYKRRIFEKLQVHNAVSLSRLMQTFKVGE